MSVNTSFELSNRYREPIQLLQGQQNHLTTKINEFVQHLVQDSKSNINAASRASLLDTLSELQQSYGALAEIYNIESNTRSKELESIGQLNARHRKLDSKIDWLNNESPEGETISRLNKKASAIDVEIESLEERLRSLKNQRSLINHQLDETKSLLEIKLSKYVSTLGMIEAKEAEKVKELASANLLPAGTETEAPLESSFLSLSLFSSATSTKGTYAISEASETLKGQIEELRGCTGKLSRYMDVNYSCLTYLKDIFDNMAGVEADLKRINAELDKNLLKQSISMILLKACDFLNMRINELNKLTAVQDAECVQLDNVRAIAIHELSVLNSGLKMVNTTAASDSSSKVALTNGAEVGLTTTAVLGSTSMHNG